MHEGVDFLFEATANSIEAKATKVVIFYCVGQETIRVKVVDNGGGIKVESPFEDGSSDKGKGRGRGLYLLKKLDEGASLEEENGFTVLAFTLKRGGEGKLSSVLPYLFSRVDLTFVYTREGKVILYRTLDLENAYGSLGRAGALAGMKQQFSRIDE